MIVQDWRVGEDSCRPNTCSLLPRLFLAFSSSHPIIKSWHAVETKHGHILFPPRAWVDKAADTIKLLTSLGNRPSAVVKALFSSQAELTSPL